MEREMMLKAVKALSDPTRLNIVHFLADMCCGRAAVNEEGGVEGVTAGEVCCHITGAEKISSTISHHLHELEDAGLIQIERKGKFMVCTLLPQCLEDVAAHLNELAEKASRRDGC